jgi:hypothetical protein
VNYDSHGNSATSRLDTDFNGKPDVIYTFGNGFWDRADWRPNESSAVIVRELFQHGVKVEELRDLDEDGQFDVQIKFGPFLNPIQTNHLKLLTKPAP